MNTPDALTQRAVNTIKFLAIDAIETANSGHPGLPMGAADFAFVLWSKFLRHDPSDPGWIDRDRFILSAGHGSTLLYSLLHLSGYKVSIDDLKQFRQWGSITPGHPEVHLTPGVEVTTGPLGQGLGNSVGMALAAKLAQERFPGLFSHRVWALVSDGDVMEGVAFEAASLAGHLRLDNLVLIYDKNGITLDGELDECMSEDVARRFEALGWYTETIDGHDHAQISAAYDRAVAGNGKPTMILARTHIGNGAPHKHDTHKVHGEPLGKEEVAATRKALSWPDETFFVPDDVRALWSRRGEELSRQRQAWNDRANEWRAKYPELAERLDSMRERRVPEGLLDALAAAAPPKTDATRSLAGAILQRAAELVPSLIGGDADLGGSTKTPIKGSTKVLPGAFEGRNIRFGIREHAMGALANGMALYGLFIPFTATFLTFSDYMRPAVRLAGLSESHVVHVFTHDSIFLGEDGPTHQPVEHVSALRLIPNVHVWRPADGAECAAAWTSALTHTHGPSELILSRQKVAAMPEGAADPQGALRGGYVVVHETGGDPEILFLATGSEVGLAVEAAGVFVSEGKRVRVVSLPCLEVFDAQDPGYKNSVIPVGTRRVSIEAGRTDLWRGRVGETGLCIGVDRFGASAPAAVLAEKYGLTTAQVVARVREWLAG